MRWIKTVTSEIVGLFVDDGSFAFAIVLWIAVVWGVSHVVSGPAGAIVFFLGLCAVLIESLVRFSRSAAK